MFIRCTRTRSRSSGEPYVTYRLVQTARVGGVVKQTTLLNLGSHFDLPQDQWVALALRIDELLRGQASLLDTALSDAGCSRRLRYEPNRGCGQKLGLVKQRFPSSCGARRGCGSRVSA